MLAPPHSLHLLLSRWCWQMLAPPHSLHVLHSRWCWQMSLLLVAPSDVAPAAAPDPLGQTRFPALPVVSVPPAARLAPASEPSGVRASIFEGAAVVKNGPHPLVPIELAMDDGVGGRIAEGGEEDDGDSTLRAVPVEAARVGSSSTRKRRRREQADAAGAASARTSAGGADARSAEGR